MENEMYLFSLQQEYIRLSKQYMEGIRAGKGAHEMNEMVLQLRSLLLEIRIIKAEIENQLEP